jgi:hypothetical protein
MLDDMDDAPRHSRDTGTAARRDDRDVPSRRDPFPTTSPLSRTLCSICLIAAAGHVLVRREVQGSPSPHQIRRRGHIDIILFKSPLRRHVGAGSVR